MRLGNVILFTLAECPMTYANLVRWVRLQWPRIVPDAIDHAVSQLHRMQFIECVDQRWRVSHEA